MASESFEKIKRLVIRELGLGNQLDDATTDTPLLGNIPEFDSMAVVNILNSIEETFGIVIQDDEITADTFADLGCLVSFVDEKLAN